MSDRDLVTALLRTAASTRAEVRTLRLERTTWALTLLVLAAALIATAGGR